MAMSKAEAGRKGGRKTFERYGAEHMAAIGYTGFLAVLETRYGGDIEAMKRCQLFASYVSWPHMVKQYKEAQGL